MNSKKIAVRGLIALAVVVALCMFFSETIRTIATAKVKIAAPRQGKLTQSVSLSGKLTFTSSEKVMLEAVDGASVTIKSIKVAVGQQVSEGDLILEAAIIDYEKTMEGLRATYDTAENQLQTLLRKNIKLKRTDQEWADAYAARTRAKEAEIDAKLALETRLSVDEVALSEGGALPDGASDELRALFSAYQACASALSDADARLSSAERYPVDDDTRTYITDKIKCEKDVADAEKAMLNLSVASARLGNVRAPMDGYITEMLAKVGEAFDITGAAYSICPAQTLPVLRADVSGVTLTMSKGMDVTFTGRNNRELESEILSVGETVSGDKYIDIELTKSFLSDMGGVYAATLKDSAITVKYRAKQATTLLPSSAVRGSDDDRYVYTLETRQNTFGVSRMVTVKTTVKVLAEADGLVSVEEDLSYQQVAYMEDRAISENTTVMEYVD